MRFPTLRPRGPLAMPKIFQALAQYLQLDPALRQQGPGLRPVERACGLAPAFVVV